MILLVHNNNLNIALNQSSTKSIGQILNQSILCQLFFNNL